MSKILTIYDNNDNKYFKTDNEIKKINSYNKSFTEFSSGYFLRVT